MFSLTPHRRKSKTFILDITFEYSLWVYFDIFMYFWTMGYKNTHAVHRVELFMLIISLFISLESIYVTDKAKSTTIN